MIVKPEKISIVSYFISVLFLFLSTVSYHNLENHSFEDIVYLLFTLIFLIYTVELFIFKLKYFLGILPIHIGAVFIVINIIGHNNSLIDVMIIVSLILNIFLKLPTLISLSLSAFVIVVPAIIGIYRSLYLETMILFLIEIVFILVCSVVIYYRENLVKTNSELAYQKSSLDNLSAANESIVQHLTEIKEESAEKERFRITRELHDSLGYSMTTIVMIMNAAQYIFEENPDKVKDYCRKTKEMASTTMEETRQTLYKLRAIDKEAPHNPAIFFDRLCSDFMEATGIITECHPGNFTRMLPDKAFNTVFRAVQVGFINALKHGRTGRIRLYFWINNEELRMTIWNNVDDHKVDINTMNEGIGIKGVRERLAELDGELKFSNTADGFNLCIIIPKKELIYEEISDHDS